MKVDTFEAHRAQLLALAYRMLGDMARAEDLVQDAWVRWERSDTTAESPKAFLFTIVTRLCLDELGSARQRHEESRGDRLPELIDLDQAGIGRVEMLDEISVAFLVLLQRLTPAERAVLLLHDVFDLGHAEIGTLLGKSQEASRQLLRRAREYVSKERRAFEIAPEEHERLLLAFFRAVGSGDQESLQQLLTEDAVLVVDPGPNGGQYGRMRQIGRPVVGRRRIVALMAAFVSASPEPIEYSRRTLNGQPALVAFSQGRALSAVTVVVEQGRICRLFFQSDPARLRYLGALS